MPCLLVLFSFDTGLIAACTGVEGRVVGCADKAVSWVFVGLVQDDREFDLPEKLQHTFWFLWINLVHVFGRDCFIWDDPVFLFLIPIGGVVIRMVQGVILFKSGCLHVS